LRSVIQLSKRQRRIPQGVGFPTQITNFASNRDCLLVKLNGFVYITQMRISITKITESVALPLPVANLLSNFQMLFAKLSALARIT
jgi:hypothetical protein